MSAPATDIAIYLENNGIGSADGVVYVSYMPDDVGACVALYDYAGEPIGVADNIQYPAIQVNVRSTNYQTAYQKITEIQTLLHGLSNEIINGSKYLYIFAKQSPFQAGGYDDNRRITLKQNYQIART